MSGLSVIDAFADLLCSALLLAVITALVGALTVGAVYRPVASMDPDVADQVTSVLEVPLTVAVVPALVVPVALTVFDPT